MERKIVHIVGTGTIGEPLIGLFCDYRDQLGIDGITFQKNQIFRYIFWYVVGNMDFRTYLLEKNIILSGNYFVYV